MKSVEVQSEKHAIFKIFIATPIKELRDWPLVIIRKT